MKRTPLVRGRHRPEYVARMIAILTATTAEPTDDEWWVAIR